MAEDLSGTAQPRVLFSGGSLLVGAVSRTDLLGHEHTLGLSHQLYHSLHAKILPLGDDVEVYPTHGAGSFCTADASAGSTTIGRERRTNPLLALTGPDAFVERLVASMPSYPTYFRGMRAMNRQGPRVLARLPRLARLTPHKAVGVSSSHARATPRRPKVAERTGADAQLNPLGLPLITVRGNGSVYTGSDPLDQDRPFQKVTVLRCEQSSAKITGSMKRAFLPCRSVSVTPRATEQEPQT